MKLLRIKLPDQLHARLKVQCAMQRISMQDALVRAIEGTFGDIEEYDERYQVDVAVAKNNPALASANPQKRGL